jgi:hypothetical protein
MPFEYQQYNNRAIVGSIAQMMERAAEIRANAAMQASQAQAQATRTSGDVWGQAINQIGHAVGQIPQQMQDARQQQQIGQIRDMQIADAKAHQAGQAQLDTLMRGDQLPPGHVGPRQESYTDANGLFDVPKLTQALAKSGMGHLAPELLKGAESINDSITKHTALEQQAAQVKTVMFGDLADGVLKLTKMGMPVDQAMDFVIQPAIATKRIQPQEYAQIKDKIASLPPDQQQAALTTFMDAAAKIDKGKTLGKDAQEVDRYGRVTASNVVPDKPTEATLALEAAKGDAAAKGAMAILKPPPVTSNEWKDVLLDGRPAKVFVDPKTRTVTDLSGKPIENAIARIKPVPPASVQINNAQAAAGATGEISPTAKAIAEYRLAPPSSRSVASGAGKALMDQVMRANPEYAADEFTRRAPMAKAFTSGPQSQAINSLNTAIGHLDQFVDVAKALDNGNFRPGNQAYNWVRTTFGDSAPTNFDGIKSIMAGELASAFKKSGATDQEIASVERAISSSASGKQLVDYATKIAIPALGSKIASYNAQYRQVMGPNDPFRVLSPDAEAVLTKHGFDPAHPTMGNKPSQEVKVGGFTVKVKP